MLRECHTHPDPHIERNHLPRLHAGVSSPTNWHEALDIIANGDPEQSVEGMKIVCHELGQATIDDIVKDADQLVSVLANKVAKTFDFSLTGASSRSCKYVLNTLMQIFQNKTLALAIKESTLDNLITELLLWLLDEQVLQSTIYDVDLDRILQSIHAYLQELGMEEIRRRAGADDKPLRMVKTVLHELVKLQGTAIKGHLSMVPIDTEPQPIILAYIDLNLQTLAAARMLTPAGPVGQTHWDDSTANNPSSTTHSVDAQLKQYSRKLEISKHAVLVFMNFTALHDYTLRWKRTSVPLSTSPPASLTYSSPKLAPLSPVNKPSLNDAKSQYNRAEPTNFTLPPSFSEDERTGNAASRGPAFDRQQVLVDQTNERLPFGVPAGTLDAIRERMKSIQLAAAGTNPDSESRPLMPMNGNITHYQDHHVVDDTGGVENPVVSGVPPMDEKALTGLQAGMQRLKSGSFHICRMEKLP